MTAFQRAAGLSTDGVVDPATWGMLDAGTWVGGAIDAVTTYVHDVFDSDGSSTGASAEDRNDQSWPVVKESSSGEWVDYLQRQLTELGFDVGADGAVFGASTEAALRRFQGIYGLVVDGIVGPRTWGALNHAEPGSFHETAHNLGHQLGSIPLVGSSLEESVNDVVDRAIEIGEGVHDYAVKSEASNQARAAGPDTLGLSEDMYELVRSQVIDKASRRIDNYSNEIHVAVTEFLANSYAKTEGLKGEPPSMWDVLVAALVDVVKGALIVAAPVIGGAVAGTARAIEAAERAVEAGAEVLGAYVNEFAGMFVAVGNEEAAGDVNDAKMKLRAEVSRLVTTTLEAGAAGKRAAEAELRFQIDNAIGRHSELADFRDEDREALCDAMGLFESNGRLKVRVLDGLEDQFDVMLARLRAEMKYEIAETEEELAYWRRQQEEEARDPLRPFMGGSGNADRVVHAKQEELDEARAKVSQAVADAAAASRADD